MLDQFIEYIAKQVHLIKGAPVVFFAAMAVVGIIIWRVLDRLYRSKDDLIALYRARLDGATPDEARERIQALEGVIKRTVGSEWMPLTAAEVEALSREVADIEKRPIQVMYLNAYGKALAKSIADAFEAADWDVQFSMGGGFEVGLFVGRSPTVGPLLKAALERATPLRAIYQAPEKGWGRDTPNSSVYVAVGTNSN